MQVATILPTPLLSYAQDCNYNMCLYQVVKDNKEYAKFFREQREQGKFVIMDNGAAEGVNPSEIALAKVYPLVEPSEVVLPDVVGNMNETLRRTCKAYKYFESKNLHKKYQFMAVPQGRTFTEWILCLKEMLSMEHITTIGVSKFVTELFAQEMRGTNVRLECVDAILNSARVPQVHLLGCYEDPKEVGEIAIKFGDKVRGVDSAIAYVYARNGIKYRPGISRPDNEEIDFHNGDLLNAREVSLPATEKSGIIESREELLKICIDNWDKACKGSKSTM